MNKQKNTKENISNKIDDLRNKSFDSVMSFLKGTSCYQNGRSCKYSNLFWQSDLPTKHFEKLSTNSIYKELLFGYFSNPLNTNDKFLDLATKNTHKPLIEIIKLTKAFEIKEHWDSFYLFKNHTNITVRNFYKELEYIKRLLENWETKSKYFVSIIEQLDYEDILIHTVAYYEKFKRSSQKAKDNRNHIVSMEMNLIYVLNWLLNIKKQKSLKDNFVNKPKYSISDFRRHTQETLPPLNTAESIAKGRYLPIEKIDNEKKLIREAIEFFFSYHGIKHQIEKYLAGFAEFQDIDRLEAELITNQRFQIFQRNDKKSSYEELFYFNKATENEELKREIKNISEPFEKEVILNIYATSEYFKYLKLPLKYQMKYFGKIDFTKTFRLLKVFSLYLMPSGRQFIGNFEDTEKGREMWHTHTLTRAKPKEFLQYFKDDYIVCIEDKELIFNCEMYFNWDKKEIENILNYLTTDLSANRPFPIDLLTRPLIKIGNQYIWLSSLLRDRRWENIMHRRIVAEKPNQHVEQSAKIEKQLADTFVKANFNAVSSYCYKGGEIDTLVYKDKTLFIIELKTSYLIEDLIRNKEYEIRKFEYKAKEQLERNIKYVRENFQEIKEIDGLEIDCNIEELKIIPLIVSNIYYADDLIFGNKFLKITMFELMIILHNDLYNLLNLKSGKIMFNSKMEIPIPLLMQMQNQNAPEIKKNNIKTDKETCNLWKDKKYCSVNDLIDAIENNKVWKFLDELRKSIIVELIDLKPFDDSMIILK